MAAKRKIRIHPRWRKRILPSGALDLRDWTFVEPTEPQSGSTPVRPTKNAGKPSEIDVTPNGSTSGAPDEQVKHHYKPRGAAIELFQHRNPEILISGPAGTGKSRACMEKLNMMALVNPGMRGLIVRKTAVSLSISALVTWKTHVIPEALETKQVHFYGGSAAEPAQYIYKNGSTIMIGGLDKASRIMSTEFDVIYVQEATELSEGDWETLTSRLRSGVVSFQQLIADCNPDVPTHWLKQRCDKGQTVMLESRHEDNPLYFDDTGVLTEAGVSYLQKLDGLTGVRKERLRYGRWVAAEGIIYEDYDPAIHVVNCPWLTGRGKPTLPPQSWTRYWVVDFGFTNPFVCQFWAEDPDGRLYLYREIYKTKTLVEDHAKHMLALMNRRFVGNFHDPRPRAIICDHDAEDRATLERHLPGMRTIPAKKGVSDGIQAVAARLRPAEDGKPRIFLVRDAVVERDQDLIDAGKPASTIEEVPGYVWDPAQKKGEQPLKQDDHGCDGMRYVVANCDLKKRTRVRFV